MNRNEGSGKKKLFSFFLKKGRGHRKKEKQYKKKYKLIITRLYYIYRYNFLRHLQSYQS